MKYTTVIFDLDGTLLDTLDDLTDAVNHALARFSLPVRTKDEVGSFLGNGIVKLMECASEGKCADFESMMAEFRSFYGTHCKEKTKPYEGVLEMLATLKNRGIQTAVISNKADFAVKILVEKYFPALLSVAMGENEATGIRKKPAPDCVWGVMETLGATKANTVYVGDSEVDIRTAENAGVDCICVLWGFRTRAFLQEQGGKVFARTAEDILRLCEVD